MTTTTLPSLSDAILDQIEAHAFSETEREVGGILVGRLVDGTASIEAAIPALRATEGATNVTFTHDVWSDVLDEVEREHPGLRIVGWYHSHPGFGLFLSEYDSFIQANFFSEPGMLALVVDPLAGELGWFDWSDGAVRELGRDATSRPAVGRTSEVKHAKRVRRRAAGRLVAGAMVFAGLAGVAGYAYGSLNAPPVTVAGNEPGAGTVAPPASDAAELQAELDQARDRIAELEGADSATISYTVKPGDSWWSISEALIGDGQVFRTVRDANPHLKGLEPGDVISIPGVPLVTPS